jgi:hypothetical protein
MRSQGQVSLFSAAELGLVEYLGAVKVHLAGSRPSSCPMDITVAVPTERNQILLNVVPEPTSKGYVVHFEVDHGATRLTAPLITL